MEARKLTSYVPINKNDNYDNVMKEYMALRHNCITDTGLCYFTHNGLTTRNLDYDLAPKRLWNFTDFKEGHYGGILYNRVYRKKHFKKFQNKNLNKINKKELCEFLNSYGIKIKYSNWIKKEKLITFIKNIDCDKLFITKNNHYSILRLHYKDIVED